MALDRNNLLMLMKTVAKADRSAPASYSWNGENFNYDTLNETLRKEMNEYASTASLYRENKNMIFSLIEETLTDVLPNKVKDSYGAFAEVKTFKQGDKPIFRRKLSARNRAKQFITRVGLAGVYETFKIGSNTESFEVPTSAIGGAAEISLEEFLDGRVDFAELTAIVMEGMDELIYKEIAKALISAIDQLPSANKVVGATGFDEVAFDKLIAVASAYGEPTIYCTYDFAVKMIPSRQWMYTDGMKEELWNNGHFTTYKGKKVIILPNGFVDETNTTRVIDPGYCWIIPSSGEDRPVKVAFEGETLVSERDNADWSKEIQVYKKVGVVALMTNNICVYTDGELAGDYSLAKYRQNQLASVQA